MTSLWCANKTMLPCQEVLVSSYACLDDVLKGVPKCHSSALCSRCANLCAGQHERGTETQQREGCPPHPPDVHARAAHHATGDPEETAASQGGETLPAAHVHPPNLFKLDPAAHRLCTLQSSSIVGLCAMQVNREPSTYITKEDQ